MKNIVLWILCILVGLNLLLTLRISLKLTGKSPEQIAKEQAKPLPQFVTKETINEISDKFIAAYGTKDIEASWNLFGDFAQAQLKKEDLQKGIDQLHSFIGPVTSAKYMYHEYAGHQGNLEFWKLYYKAKLTDQCKISEIGTLKITIATDQKEYQIVEFRIDADTK